MLCFQSSSSTALQTQYSHPIFTFTLSEAQNVTVKHIIPFLTLSRLPIPFAPPPVPFFSFALAQPIKLSLKFHLESKIVSSMTSLSFQNNITVFCCCCCCCLIAQLESSQSPTKWMLGIFLSSLILSMHIYQIPPACQATQKALAIWQWTK